jgi:hypothetical protein
MAAKTTSDFYWACRNGDINTVEKILPNLTSSDINRIESNGSTALHAASYFGHANIVRLLLQRGADTTIRNKFKETAKNEASTDEVRAIFESSIEVEEAYNDDDDMPQSEFVQVYRNAKGMEKSALATRILKARLSTYHAHKYTISAASNLDHLEKKFRKLCEAQENKNSLQKGEEYMKQYRETGDFDHMIRLYTAETSFYGMIRDDETFLVEIYKHLFQYKKYAFQGRTYRAVNLLLKDFEPYQWALVHPSSLVEMRKVTSTSPNRTMAEGFLRNSTDSYRYVLLEMDFMTKNCFTTMDIQSVSEYPGEKEVLVLSGTFFQVTDIRKDDNGLTIISLNNIPVDKDVISSIM